MLCLVAAFVFSSPPDRWQDSSLALPIPATDSRLVGSKRFEREGWIYLRLQGKPYNLGFQNGYWLANEIHEQLQIGDLGILHDHKDPAAEWKMNRATARRLFWKYCNQAERDELQGIADGMRSKGYKVDVDDMLAYNGGIDLSYFYSWLDGEVSKQRSQPHPPERCSAFVATGSATKDGKVVIAHSCWTDYISGERDNVILDIHPDRGYRILMDAFPGFIQSGDDYAVNSQGLAMTETTISGYRGFDESGIPEFLRMRRAIQFSKSIDDIKNTMVTGNNGAYANMWLMADAKNNEIAKLELGLKHFNFVKTKDGSFGSSNFPEDPLVAEECPGFTNGSNICSDRKRRWEVLLNDNKGKIDVEMGKLFLADHYDEQNGNKEPSASSLCGHGEDDGRSDYLGGSPFLPMGAVQGKVTDAAMIKSMSFWARMGHPCGADFIASKFLSAHPEYAWQAPMLRDMKGHQWTVFAAN